jgi:hypothetical protein
MRGSSGETPETNFVTFMVAHSFDESELLA